MNRQQSGKMGARAALAALLSLVVFAICVTGMVAAQRSHERRENGRLARQLIETWIGRLEQDATPGGWQKSLPLLVQQNAPIVAALVVGRDYQVKAALPGRGDLVGRFVGPNAAPSDAASRRRHSSAFNPATPPWIPDWPLADQVAQVMRETPGIGSSAMATSLIKESLTDSNGDHVGWLFVLPRSDSRDGGLPEALVPLLGIGALTSFTLYWFMLPLWVYLDARPRTGKAVPLALFVFLTNFLGWLTYLVIRPESDRLCAACDAPMEPGFRLCPLCGWSGALRCHQCGRATRADWRYCPHCEAARPDADLGAELTGSGGSAAGTHPELVACP